MMAYFPGPSTKKGFVVWAVALLAGLLIAGVVIGAAIAEILN